MSEAHTRIDVIDSPSIVFVLRLNGFYHFWCIVMLGQVG